MQGITVQESTTAIALLVVDTDADLRRRYRQGLMALGLSEVVERSPGPAVWALWQHHWPPLTVVSDRALVELIVAAPAELPPVAGDRPRPVLLVAVSDRPELSCEVLWQRLGTLDQCFTLDIVPDRPDALVAAARRATQRASQLWERDRLEQQQRWLWDLMQMQQGCPTLRDRLRCMAGAMGRWFGGARVVFYTAEGDAIVGLNLGGRDRDPHPTSPIGPLGNACPEALDRNAFATLRDQLMPPDPLGGLQVLRATDAPTPSAPRQFTLVQQGLASEAILPLVLPAQSPYLWGFLAIQHPQPYPWHPCDRAFLNRLPGLLAMAITSAGPTPPDAPRAIGPEPRPAIGPAIEPTVVSPHDSTFHLRMTITHSPVILYAIDAHGTFTLSEGLNLQRIGLKSGEAVGQNVFDLYRDHPDVCQYIREALAGQRTHWQTNIGNIIYDNRASLLRDSDGNPISLIGVATDVTERTLAEQALQALNADLEHHIRQRTQQVESSNNRLRQSIATSRRIEQILQRKTAEFKAILNALPDAVLVVSPEGTIVLANPAFERLLGHRWAEILGKPLNTLDHIGGPQLTSLLRCDLPIAAGHLPQRTPEPLRLTIRDCNGVPIPVETRCAAVCDRHGQPIGTVGILRDIRERQRTEAALQRSQARFRRLAANIPGVLHQFQRNADGTYVINYVSKHFQALCGRAPAEVYANPLRWIEALHPRDRRPFSKALIRSATHLDHLSWEGRLLLPKGGVRWVQCMAKPEGQPDGTILWDGLLIDIGDRKATATELAQQRDLRVAFFEESTDALFLVDPVTHLTLDCNQQAVAIFGAKRAADLKGFAVNDLQVTPLTDAELADLANALQTYGVWSREVEYRTLQGRHFWGNLAVRTIAVAGHSLNLVRLTDISDRKTVESQLRAANHQLELANQELARATRLKDEFLANMSHELRTPLNAVIGLAEGLSAEVYGPLNARQRKTLTTIHRSGGLLLSLINDILDLSKIEAGKLALEITEVNVKRLLEASLTFVRQMAMEKHVQLECHLHQPGPRYYGDERRLCQLLVNLLSNAVKFTPEGGHIVLAATYESLTTAAAIALATPDPSEGAPALDLEGEAVEFLEAEAGGARAARLGPWLRFAVSDTGIGIASEHLTKLFEPFTQIDSSLSRAHNGTGLGLALVQRIARLHGGAVTVTSAPGRGSCFSVWLPPPAVSVEGLPVGRPLALPNGDGDGAIAGAGGGLPRDRALDCTEGVRRSRGERRHGGPQRSRAPRILVAEDNETNIQVLRDYLQAQGYEVLLARNGLEAVRQARGLRPDLILMDVQMPLVDGLAATRRLRGDDRFADLPILALTAHAMAGDRERCLAAGMTDYLSKPIQFAQLLATMEGYLTRRDRGV